MLDRGREAKPLTIALSKGRILSQTLPLLAAAGLNPAEDVQKTRKLMVSGDADRQEIRFLMIRAAKRLERSISNSP